MNRLVPTFLLALLALAPFASAADPQPLAWSPYAMNTPVLAVAFAADGTTIAAGLAPNPPPAPGTTPSLNAPRVTLSDLFVLDADAGFVQNSSSYLQPPPGRPFVAVSRDGATVASIGDEVAPSTATSGGIPGVPSDPTNPSAPTAPTPSSQRAPRLQYMRVAAGANFSAATTYHNVTLDGVPAGLLLSEDGRRVVVASVNGSLFSLRGYVHNAGGLLPTFHHKATGNVTALAAPGTLDRFFALAQLPQGQTTRGAVLSVPFGTGEPTGSHADLTVENSTVRGIAVSRDGGVLAVGTGGGRLLVFANPGTQLPEPLAVDLNASVSLVAVSENGARIAAVHGSNLTHMAYEPGAARALWTTSHARPYHSLAYNRTGGILYAAVPGDALLAYGETDGAPLWRSQGDARSVSVGQGGETIAFGRANLVVALRLTHQIFLEHADGKDAAAPKGVAPGGAASWDLQVRNNGSAPETVTLSAPQVDGLRLTFSPATMYVRPGESKRVVLSAEADPTFVGSRTFNVSVDAGPLHDETTVGLALQTTAVVSLVVDTTDLTVRAGEPVHLLVAVQNKGTRDAAVGLRVVRQVSAGEPWPVDVDPASFTLAANSLTTVRVTVTPPSDAPNGTSLALTLQLEGADVSDQATVNLRINPSLGLEVGATPRIKFVQPGKAAHYNVTVKNTGSVARTFEAWYDLVPAEGATPRSWAVDMSASEFRLDAGATRTIPVRILAPMDVTPGDRVAVRVNARMIPLNDTEERIQGNVTLFANGEALPPTPEDTEDNPVPAPGLLPLAAVAASLVLLRRRRLP